MKVEIKDGNFFYSQDIPSFFFTYLQRGFKHLLTDPQSFY